MITFLHTDPLETLLANDDEPVHIVIGTSDTNLCGAPCSPPDIPDGECDDEDLCVDCLAIYRALYAA